MILVSDIFPKRTGKTPKSAIDACKQRFSTSDRRVKEAQAGEKPEKGRSDG